MALKKKNTIMLPPPAMQAWDDQQNIAIGEVMFPNPHLADTKYYLDLITKGTDSASDVKMYQYDPKSNSTTPVPNPDFNSTKTNPVDLPSDGSGNYLYLIIYTKFKDDKSELKISITPFTN